MLKPFHAHYYDSWAYGNFESAELVIIANDKDEALGRALESIPISKAEKWTLTEIPIDKPAAFYLASEGGPTVNAPELTNA